MQRAFNATLFKNRNDKITFSKKKGEKVKADYNGNGSENDGADKIQIVGINAVSEGGRNYKRLCFIDRTDPDSHGFFNGALFQNEKKEEGSSQPDYFGSVDLDSNGEDRLRLAAWVKKSDKAGTFLSISVSEFLPKTEGESSGEQSTGEPQGSKVPAFADMDDDIPF